MKMTTKHREWETLKDQLFGTICGVVAGSSVGLLLGVEAVAYANTISENPDLLSYTINQHPHLTKIVTTLTGWKIGAEIGRTGVLMYYVAKDSWNRWYNHED